MIAAHAWMASDGTTAGTISPTASRQNAVFSRVFAGFGLVFSIPASATYVALKVLVQPEPAQQSGDGSCVGRHMSSSVDELDVLRRQDRNEQTHIPKQRTRSRKCFQNRIFSEAT